MTPDEMTRIASAVQAQAVPLEAMMWQLAEAIYLRLSDHALLDGPEDARERSYDSARLADEAWCRAREFLAAGRARLPKPPAG